jgi:hypothetical protein
MFRTAFLKLPLITLSLSLAACGSEQALNPPVHLNGRNVDTPASITCDVPGPKPRTILVPAGRDPVDFCPATAITYHTPYYPLVVNGPAPADAADIQMEQDKLANEELRALALRNKTSAQQTPGQPP